MIFLALRVPVPSFGALTLAIMAGNLASSVLGLVRLQVINGVFGQTGQTGAFFAALKTPQQLSDLLIGGAVSGALIPTFARFAAPEQRGELQRILSSVITLVALMMLGAVVVLGGIAPWLVPALNSGFAPTYRQLTVHLVWILALMLPGLGIFAVTSALLYALKRSLFPALAAGMYHLGMIAGALVLARWWGIGGLAVGAVLGVAGQVALLVPVWRSAGLRYRPEIAWRHPAMSQLRRLYAPIVLGLLVSLVMQQLDQWLQSQTLDAATGLRGGPNVAALASATMLIQFPAGIVAAAVAFAALPQLAHAGDEARRFAATLRQALALGLGLMLPITVAYLTLSGPIVALLLQHHAFHAADTTRTALALRNYAWQLPFLVVEQVMLAAFFARQQPRIPLITGILSSGGYLLVALPLGHPLTMPTLALANAALHITNATLLAGWYFVATNRIFRIGIHRLSRY